MWIAPGVVDGVISSDGWSQVCNLPISAAYDGQPTYTTSRNSTQRSRVREIVQVEALACEVPRHGKLINRDDLGHD